MKKTKIIMGMPVTLDIKGANAFKLETIFDYFVHIDNIFSTYKENSEISRFNSGYLLAKDLSIEVIKILKLAEQTKKETGGYFDARRNGKIDPSGIVKGWAIFNAAEQIKEMGFHEFFVDAGSDIEARGKVWRVGIKNPFKQDEIIKVLKIQNRGIATSGNYIRGAHIYDPINNLNLKEIVSLTVIGPNIYEADRLATAAFAMGRKGIGFIEGLKGFEGYMINSNGIATFTSGFSKYETN